MDTTRLKRQDLLQVLQALWGEHYSERRICKDFRSIRRGIPLAERQLKKVAGRDLCLADGARLVIGGGGIVVECFDSASPTVKYALKVPRPSLFTGDPTTDRVEVDKAKTETQVHFALAHANIAKNIGWDEVTIKQTAALQRLLPVALVEWVEGATPLNRAIKQCHSPIQVADYLRQSCSALAYLHRRGWVHWDIKGDNLLVSTVGEVKLMDLGNAHSLQNADAVYVNDDLRESTLEYLPPALLRRVTPVADSQDDARPSSNRTPITVYAGETVWDRPWLDLYMLARTFLSALEPSESADYQYRYITEILTRMLLAESPSSPCYYTDAQEVIDSLDRLTPEFGAASEIPEFYAVPQHVIRLPPGRNVVWTRRIERTLKTPMFNNLNKHLQLATCIYVYPGARHTRWEHSVGTLEQTIQVVRALYSDRNSVFFRLETSRLDVEALMLAALLHDIAHPAFGHQLEESPAVDPLRYHEHYALEMLRRLLDESHVASSHTTRTQEEQDNERKLYEVILSEWCAGDETSAKTLLSRVTDIMSVPEEAPLPDNPVECSETVHLQIMKSVISGQMDADKRDYLLRDCHHCGVPYSLGIDLERLDQALTTCLVTPTATNGCAFKHGAICVSEKGQVPLESLIVARYQMFSVVYWHRSVRAMTAMLHRLVEMYVVVRDRGDWRIDESRLDDLLAAFRAKSDTDALDWLVQQLEETRRKGRSALAGRVDQLAAGVNGDHDKFWWSMAEFRGRWSSRRGASDDPINRLYERLLESLSPLGGTVAVFKARRNIRASLCQKIKDELPQGRVVLDADDIIIDVPVSGKDQIRDLWVVQGEDCLPLTDVTPLAQAVADAFQRSVRAVRVFMDPDIADKLVKEVSRIRKVTFSEAEAMTHQAVSRAFVDVVSRNWGEQKPLFAVDDVSPCLEGERLGYEDEIFQR